MANSSSNSIPTLDNWGEVESRNFYKGVEVVKINKTSVRPKEGTQPRFKYKNKKGVLGHWYAITDVMYVDKTMQAENKRFATDLHKKLKAGEIDMEKMQEVLDALGIAL